MAAMFDKSAPSINVGIRLRELREERGISMRGLAQKSGLSANALSMIERGKTSPSVSTLYKLADAMDLPITAFFGEQAARQSIVFMKGPERPRVSFMRGVWEGLGGEQFLGHVEPFILTLESGGSSGPNAMVHTGHEFVFCLRGALEYQVENEVYLLEPGDSLLFAARLHHKWRNPGGSVVNALIVLSDFSDGDRPGALHLTRDE